jgi:hypothetical protein
VGEWDASGAIEKDVHHRGFLIIEGLMSREVHVLGRECVELLGEGDVLRPWRWDPDGSHVHAEVGWVVLEPTQLAVLDHGLVNRMNPWPQLGLELFARGTRRAHSLAVALAIAHHQRVEDRLLLTLWHLAERWGRVRPDGIILPLPLSHRAAPPPPRRRDDVTQPSWRRGAKVAAGGRPVPDGPAAGLANQTRPASSATIARIAIRNRSGWMAIPPATAMIRRMTARTRSMVTSGSVSLF